MLKFFCIGLMSMTFLSCDDSNLNEVVNKRPLPVNLSVVSFTKNTVKLQWTKYLFDDFARYEVYYSSSNRIDSNAKPLLIITNVDSTSLILEGLLRDTTYYFIVNVVSNNGLSSKSNTINETPRSTWRIFNTTIKTNPTCMKAFSKTNIYLGTTSGLLHFDGNQWSNLNVPKMDIVIDDIAAIDSVNIYFVGHVGFQPPTSYFFKYASNDFTLLSTTNGSYNFFDNLTVAANDNIYGTVESRTLSDPSKFFHWENDTILYYDNFDRSSINGIKDISALSISEVFLLDADSLWKFNGNIWQPVLSSDAVSIQPLSSGGVLIQNGSNNGIQFYQYQSTPVLLWDINSVYAMWDYSILSPHFGAALIWKYGEDLKIVTFKGEKIESINIDGLGLKVIDMVSDSLGFTAGSIYYNNPTYGDCVIYIYD